MSDEGFSGVGGIDPRTHQQGYGTVSYGSDAALGVRFHWHPVHLGHQSQAQGRPVYEKRVYVEITVPGGKTVIDREVTDEDKARFPRHWAAFQQGNEQSAIGTPVEKCALYDIAQIEGMKAAKIYSVEQVASLSDQQGPVLGPHWRQMRDQANAWLTSAKDTALATKQAAVIADLQGQITALTDQFKTLAGERGISPEAIEQTLAAPRRRGIPPKQAEQAA